jgi:anti-sigma factor ChrR (cupin superfamily)
MHISNIRDFKGGWFIGNFEPTLFPTEQFEVALKTYHAGDCDAPHVHKKATEFTLVVKGIIKLNGNIFQEGDIIQLDKNEPSNFSVIEDAVTFIVKIPCVKNDKYII